MKSFALHRRAVQYALLAALSFLSLTAVRADDAKPFLHPLFMDNMVLQRGISDPVWGWTTPGANVTVQVAGKGAKAVAGADGKWMAKLPPLPVGGPYTLTITGPQTVTLNNVLVGDVWICSGQSNMSFSLSSALNGPAEVAEANYPNIRLFTVDNMLGNEPRSAPKGQWAICTPQTVGGFSAVGYFFGRDLQQNLHVPLGLINTSWSGTPIEAWTSAEALSTIPDSRPALVAFQKTALAERNGTTYDQLMEPWYARHDPGSAPGSIWANPAFDTSAWKTMTLPQGWKSAGIPELANFDGTVWFRRTFDLPAAWVGKDLTLHLGQVSERDTTYVNGTIVGQMHQWWQQRDYTIPIAVLRPGQNVLAIRDFSLGMGNSGFVGPSEKMSLQPAGDPAAVPLSLAGPWLYHVGTPRPGNDDPIPRYIDSDSSQPTVLYNGMIAPLIPFGVKGAIWYQGESNAGNGKLYQAQLPTMITDWRSHLGVGDFPFLVVQIANFMQPQPQPGQSNWAELREAQLLTSERVPNVGLAVADDIGDANDIHPKNKQEVGRRLALVAEAIAYGQKIEYSGPLYQSMSVEGSSVRLHFTHLGGGLVAKGGDKLTGFAIAGADGKFVWADAKIDGSTVVVSSPDAPAPTAVRYAWADNPVCNLYNQAGLPASPFRTDSGVK